MNKSIQQGFTLIEVMVVVVILGILAAVIIPNVIGKDEQARRTLATTSLSNVANALEMYRLDNHKYPTTQEGLEALVNKAASAKVFPQGGYLKSLPNDPWDNPIQYVSPGTGGKSYDLYSFASDGQEGGEGDNADIYHK
ncbi:MAG: type II secretion system major pseudopilin GspG [Agitococcus sp.]|jgi:general secretion pathway protein G|nr:type II secretion system major pseudopilin GspG [Moraxellaceae bacterium]MBP9215909.1 type II secretion system major pseudopilin GspG [Agitococcus sp.]MBK7299835.1 type II secretion system major pseudopilin GspG [Moraxellaceae bacterium]MBK8326455.1 type II secretion system major pseudopilin GspG [Moraxellaceae bacterium]MBK9185363.1 type II secretion system major pseudopilin GspG [Moraxellaceae bacterium]